MSTKKTTRLLILVCLLALSTGLIAYSALGINHKVGSDQVSEAAFTHLSHSGRVERAGNGELAYAEWYAPKETQEVKAVSTALNESTGVSVVNVAETKPAAKPVASSTAKPAAKPAPKPAAKPATKKPEPAKPAAKATTTTKKPAGTTASKPAPANPSSKPAAPKQPEAKKPETKKPAEKAPAPEKKPEAEKPACPT